MDLKLVFSYFSLLNVHAMENHFLIDYFKYKQAASVVGVSCNRIEDDLSLLKKFSENGITASVNNLNNGSGINLLASTNYSTVGIFLDTRCYSAEHIYSIFLEASDYRMFGELHYWLILGWDLDDVLNVIYDRAFGLSTDLVIAVPANDTDYQYELYDAYNMLRERGGTLNVTFFGIWKDNQGVSVNQLQTKFERRANLHNFTIKLAYFHLVYRSVNESLKEYFHDYAHASRDAQSKFGFYIMSHLSDLYNFSLEHSETPKYKPGDAVGPVARALLNEEADFTGNTISMTGERTYFLKYVHQDWPFRTCFIFRNPQPTSIKVQEILRPFTAIIWYLMAILVMLSVTVLTVALSSEGFHNLTIQISNSVLLTVGALCQQGTDMKMKRLSTRIAFLSVLIFSLLMYNYYSASVVSARLDEPIFKINDSLVAFGKERLKMASESMIYLEFFLKMPFWETKLFYENYWLKLPKNERIMDTEQGMMLVEKGGFAYHTHPDIAYRYIEKHYGNREICELMEVHVAQPVHNAFAVTYNSSFVEIARVGLTKITEVGLRRRQVLRWQFRKPRCRKDILTATSINMYEFAPHLLLLMIGMLMATIFCAIEIFVVNHGAYALNKIILWIENFCSRQIIEI